MIIFNYEDLNKRVPGNEMQEINIDLSSYEIKPSKNDSFIQFNLNKDNQINLDYFISNN